MLLLHNTIPLICFFIENTILPLQVLANLSRGCVTAFRGRRILFRSWEPYFAGAGTLFRRRGIPFRWLLLVLNHIS
jgi:hypothetical protein